ncbi:SpoIID/LytB domain-containing protein [Paenibacillus sp. GCM10027627]|uniref:SpoIID/LytB domain-containing protein n=1 Tax=unclassified Paenibacillus TaxID=185978 RepID=UPI00362E87E8
MTYKSLTTVKKVAITVIAFLLLFSTWTAHQAQAAVPSLDTIRVALFLQLPGKYDSTTSAATFQSAGGMDLGVRSPGGIRPMMSVPAGKQVRFAVDDYKVKLAESKNFASALAVYQYVKTAKGNVYLTSLSKNGALTYQVLEGMYKTAEESKAALARWNADAKLISLLNGFKPEMQGPMRLETAALEGKGAAQAAADAFGGAGFDAYVAVRASAKGDAVYSVMVGGASTQEELKVLQAAATKAPGGAALKAIEAGSEHMLMRNDHSVSGKAGESHELFVVPAGVKAWLSPAGDKPIGLTERSKRTYRGQFEISSFNGRLAVINELPFEQYLYSVVAVEMYPSWPIEALKAQAVAARSYALNKGFGFQIAHVVDTTLSQAYYGAGSERPASTEAVEATKGQVALYNGKVIEAVFSSNGGGMTADAKEAWNNAIPYLQAVPSPDESAEEGAYSWHRIVLPSGLIGYIREDLVKDTGRKTAAGSRIMELTTDGTNIRKHPVIQDSVPVVAKLGKGEQVIVLETVVESNPMSWIRGPFTGAELLTTINARTNPKLTAPLLSLEVSSRGPSGRATELSVNGMKVKLSSPDSIRGALGVGGSLPSTLFTVDETAKVAIQGAGGEGTTRTDNSQKVYVMGAGGKSAALEDPYLYVLNGEGDIRAATKDASFEFRGTGFGHGVGLSQYGALTLAKQGYDYEYILKYYYKGITVAKE